MVLQIVSLYLAVKKSIIATVSCISLSVSPHSMNPSLEELMVLPV